MRDGRGERAALEPESADEPQPDSPRAEVALDHRDLREVPLRVGERLAGMWRDGLDERVGDDLAGNDPDHASLPSGPGNAELLRAEGADPHGMANPVRPLRMRDLGRRQ